MADNKIGVGVKYPESYYFVDEAGDVTLFNKRGATIVGHPGVSNYFMLGFVKMYDMVADCELLRQLHGEIVKDPYFHGVPSFSPSANKTAICFHAHDDVPEVRYRVFNLLKDLEYSVKVVIRRKSYLAEFGRGAYQLLGNKIDEHVLYDDMVHHLFWNELHKAGENHITFARRGKSNRQAALQDAIRKGLEHFKTKFNKDVNPRNTVRSGYLPEYTGLQVADYSLWALQRLYERGESRFFDLIEGKFSYINDMDDVRKETYGEQYTKKNRISWDKIKPEEG